MNGSNDTQILVLGWNFRGASGAVRERVAFSSDEVRDGLRRLTGRGLVSESVIVSTCHRSEIYGLGNGERAGDELASFVSEWRGLDRAVLEQAGFRRFGAEAVRHLFRVAAGLDSMALGESEVLGQVRQALSIARETGSSHGVLHRLFESAVRAGKRVRTETQIAVHPLSIASIAVELAEKVFGDLPQRTLLLLGAGETATLFARHALEAGLRDLKIANRTAGHAEDLAARVGARVVAWDAVGRDLPSADVVVGTTASPVPVVRRADVEAAMRQRRGQPMFFLDLAMPPDIDPEVRNIYNVFSYDLDGLEEVAAENRRRRSREIPGAEQILEEELERFLGWYGNLSVVPTVTELKRRLEEIRDGELDRLPPDERERLRPLADSIVARLLHEPLRRLKAEKDPAKRLDRVEAIRHLFDLDREE
ncbi:MAG TPA: glutamyl-tRNA reductase [Thermoanaerobaculia bacterium]|jgi:glutamyl-tRNA reductase|nr:glutamyl-tRNA reductase [Thermoanaerobaculia bacterium]HEV8609126.1 glutamyl-tRNA reductase [Thermoanaerobaculia bacterium]